MVGSEDLLASLVKFGRGSLQEFVARSRNVSDATAYLLAELHFELSRVTSFKTKDLVTFERKQVSRCEQRQPTNPSLEH